MFEIINQQVSHLVAQIRAKQLATKDSQARVQAAIIQYCENHPDISDKEIGNKIVNELRTYQKVSKEINNHLRSQTLNDIGFPIKYNKTSLQLQLAKEWAEHQEEELISQIKYGKFYHKLTNTIDPSELPRLKATSDQTYWGNENPSVSSILLSSISVACNKTQKTMPGASTEFPFPNASYELPDDLISDAYPFASKNGMVLFGDYQYGAHRYLKEPLLFGPEDCSSAVGKATYLKNEQIRTINTVNIQTAYSDSGNEYPYKAVTCLRGKIKNEQVKLIQPGDIYLVRGHVAIIATKPDNESNITTFQFARDIESPMGKSLGGGLYDYNLFTEARETEKVIYILRPDFKPLHESCSLRELLDQVGLNYLRMFPEEPMEDIPGDCRMFLDINEI